MSVLVLVEAEVKTEKFDIFRSMLEHTLPETRQQDGCEYVQAFIESITPCKLVLIERWQTVRLYKHYRLWRIKSGAIELFNSLLTTVPTVRILEEI